MHARLRRIGGIFAIIFLGLLWSGMTAMAAPGNDFFANAEVLDPAGNMVTGTNIDASEEGGEPVHGGVGGGSTVWWMYEAQQNGFLTVSTLDSVSVQGFELDTVLAVYTGNHVGGLTLVASNDDDEDSGSYGSKVTFPVQSGTRYYIVVDGWFYEDGTDEGYIVLRYAYTEKLPTKTAPAWNLPSPDGTMVSSTNFAGKLTLVNFWATWCGPCVDEIPDLIELHNEYERFGFAVIGISIDNGSSGRPPSTLVGNFAANYGMNYPVVMTRPTWSGVEDQFGDLSFIPTTFLVNQNNEIVQTVVGARNNAFFEAMIRPYVFANIGLNVRQEGTETVIEWQSLAGAATVQVESVNGLGSAWTALNTPVADDGVTASVRIEGGTTGFYRLRINP